MLQELGRETRHRLRRSPRNEYASKERVREILQKFLRKPVSLRTPSSEEEDTISGDFIQETRSSARNAAAFTLLKEQL